jgi:hypothetical protein
MNNIGYISHGYNIFKGDTIESKIDPGFSINKIFDLKYEENNITEDQRYIIPDRVEA